MNIEDDDVAPDSTPTRPETPVSLRAIKPSEELNVLLEELYKNQKFIEIEDQNHLIRVIKPILFRALDKNNSR